MKLSKNQKIVLGILALVTVGVVFYLATYGKKYLYMLYNYLTGKSVYFAAKGYSIPYGTYIPVSTSTTAKTISEAIANSKHTGIYQYQFGTVPITPAIAAAEAAAAAVLPATIKAAIEALTGITVQNFQVSWEDNSNGDLSDFRIVAVVNSAASPAVITATPSDVLAAIAGVPGISGLYALLNVNTALAYTIV